MRGDEKQKTKKHIQTKINKPLCSNPNKKHIRSFYKILYWHGLCDTVKALCCGDQVVKKIATTLTQIVSPFGMD